MLRGKKILLGITGSIAAYKSIFLIRLLVKEGAEVKPKVEEKPKERKLPVKSQKASFKIWKED